MIDFRRNKNGFIRDIKNALKSQGRTKENSFTQRGCKAESKIP